MKSWSVEEDAIFAWVLAGSELAADHIIWADRADRIPDGCYILMELGEMDQVASDVQRVIVNPDFVADFAFTSDYTTNVLTKVAHTLETGDGPYRLTGASLPPPLVIATDYYVIRLSANDFQLATSLVLALASTPVDLTADGTGTFTDPASEYLAQVTGDRNQKLTIECYANTTDKSVAQPVRRLRQVLDYLNFQSVGDALYAGGVGIGKIGTVQPVSISRSTVFEARARVEINLHFVSQITEPVDVIERVEITNQVTDDVFTV